MQPPVAHLPTQRNSRPRRPVRLRDVERAKPVVAYYLGRPARVYAGVGWAGVSSDERWLAALWPFVRGWLPDPPAAVLEIGCGPLGGFVPMLRSAGYQAIGVDPEAPEGPWYHGVEFETYDRPGPVQAIVACTSLHHVADLGEVLALAESALTAAGRLVVVEWARERFDEATARWCFQRLPPRLGERGWLQKHQDDWRASGLPWDGYCQAWAESEGLHGGQEIVRELDARFDRRALAYGPYFFPDLADVGEHQEQAAIDAGEIQPNRISYVGERR
jgi:SAM-dependent methyltransferase